MSDFLEMYVHTFVNNMHQLTDNQVEELYIYLEREMESRQLGMYTEYEDVVND